RFERITLKINGGCNGAEDRVARLEWARAALKGE
ncbi:glycoside hydrolase family 19 protein, partial [Pseudomonas aeruginosa]